MTLAEAGIGYLWGNGIALVLAALVLVVPRLEGVVMQLAIITYCIPIVAVGLLADRPDRADPHAGQPAARRCSSPGSSVFFTTVVGALLGLKSADKSSLDLVAVYGGSPVHPARKVRLIAALPAILNALQIAVPAAFLGAVLGEFFGKIEVRRGHRDDPGPAELNAPLRVGHRPRPAVPSRCSASCCWAWSPAASLPGRRGSLMTTLTAAHELQATAAPRRRDLSARRPPGARPASVAARPRAGASSTFVLTLVAVLASGSGILWVFQISPLVAKGPVDVWNYFFTVPDAAANRELIMGNLMVTLGHALDRLHRGARRRDPGGRCCSS